MASGTEDAAGEFTIIGDKTAKRICFPNGKAQCNGYNTGCKGPWQ